MKKAFDANVSRAKPRVRLGSLMTATSEDSVSTATVEALAQQISQEETPDLASALKARAMARAQQQSAVETLREAISQPSAPVQARTVVLDEVNVREAATWAAPVVETPAPVQAFVQPQVVQPQPVVAPQVVATVVAHAEPLPSVTEVQTAPPPDLDTERDPSERRERLRERLKAVRENPRPEPLPDTVAEAGVLAVERISALQTELAKSRAMNLALAQDLEAARRQSERATEEARMRMDEARRLSKEMEGRVTLLSELERELEALEGERNESLLALQESRQVLELREREKLEMAEVVAKKDLEISESLAEEERLAGELEVAQETMLSLRRSSDALKGERDTLARQVSELTRERAELLEARKALEAVHRALSSAAMR
jgi:DNA repair exonuclease SbcCD ATPase subunit